MAFRNISGSARDSFRVSLLATAMATLALLPAGQAQAQESGEAAASSQAAVPEVEGNSNEIIVTATRRSQALNDTPVAVGVTSGELLARWGRAKPICNRASATAAARATASTTRISSI